jgi:hypothetical protein
MYVLFKQQPSSLFSAPFVVRAAFGLTMPRENAEGQPAATQRGQPAATQKGEDCTHCGDTHPAVSSAGSGYALPESTTPQRAQGASVE